MSEHEQRAQVADPAPTAGPPYPAAVRVAAGIWIVAGGLSLVFFGVLFVLMWVQVADGEVAATGSVVASCALLGVVVGG
jgi:hypothetical protein